MAGLCVRCANSAGIRLSLATLWSAMVRQWTSAFGQRIRDDAVHGVESVVAHTGDAATFSAGTSLRLPAWRTDVAGEHDGAEQSTDHAPDACTSVAAAEPPCLRHYDKLFVVGLHILDRLGRVAVATRSVCATVGRREPYAALSCSFLYGRRHIHWCHLGQCELGPLLGMGPQGGVGANHTAGLRICLP